MGHRERDLPVSARIVFEEAVDQGITPDQAIRDLGQTILEAARGKNGPAAQKALTERHATNFDLARFNSPDGPITAHRSDSATAQNDMIRSLEIPLILDDHTGQRVININLGTEEPKVEVRDYGQDGQLLGPLSPQVLAEANHMIQLYLGLRPAVLSETEQVEHSQAAINSIENTEREAA